MRQTKVYISLMSLLMVVLAACNSAPKGCNIEGRVKGKAYEGRMVCLQNPYTGETVDSLPVTHGAFGFILGEQQADVFILELKVSDDDRFPIILPIVAENGTLKVVLGEKVLTSGTPLNDSMQDFLLAVDHFSDEAMKGNKELEAIRKDFAKLLEASILQNKDNGVGIYIFRAYSSRLTPEHRAAIFEKAGEDFQKKIEQQ